MHHVKETAFRKNEVVLKRTVCAMTGIVFTNLVRLTGTISRSGLRQLDKAACALLLTLFPLFLIKVLCHVFHSAAPQLASFSVCSILCSLAAFLPVL